MTFTFSKMHGLGNDFVVIDAIRQQVELSPDQVRRIADRRFGVGCDQLLLVERPESKSADFRYRIYNADGSEVEQCGNGARCFGRFVVDQGLADASCASLKIETLGGPIEIQLLDGHQVQVDMGVPRFDPSALPFEADAEAAHYALDTAGQLLDIGAVSMGNPHAVLWVDEIQEAPVAELGPAIESHPRFPQRVNAGFAQCLSRSEIHLRVYERGAGETLACGTGACAAVAVGIRQGKLDREVTVHLPGGDLNIYWPDDDQSLMMTGDAITVFEGTIDLSSF
ncbi:diaminopimelate epimerase [gamma proteobacterium HTCC5015]|nr:diaminopimelate epimerase [gamma proteobacterium HTCC5015]